jgi:hypothetical protein
MWLWNERDYEIRRECSATFVYKIGKDKVVKSENMHDYGAIVPVGGRCGADFGLLEICRFTKSVHIFWLVDF